MSDYPFEKIFDQIRAEGEKLLELYAKPDTIVACHQAVRDLWEFSPHLLAGVLADWWGMSRINHGRHDNTEEPCSLVGVLSRFLNDGTPQDVAAGVAWDMMHGYPESGRYRLRRFLSDASYRDTCTMTDTLAELILKVGDPL